MGGQGCAARGHGYGPCVVRRVRYVVPFQVVPEGVGEEPEEAGVAGRGGGGGWGRGPLAVLGVEVPAVGAVGEAVRGSQADPVVLFVHISPLYHLLQPCKALYMASIDPKTMKRSGFWLEKCDFPKVCACQSGFFLVSSKVLISGTRSCFNFASNYEKLAIFSCARRSGI